MRKSLQNFQIERDDFEEELRRLIYTNEQIISETSIEGAENLKFKLKQLQNKWRTFNTDLHTFEVNPLLSPSLPILFSFPSGEISST